MGYESIGIEGTDQKYTACYASTTAAAARILLGRAVAFIPGAATHDTGDGTGFGYAVDYPIATNSIVVGITDLRSITGYAVTTETAGEADTTNSIADGRPMQVVTRGISATAFTGTSSNTLTTLSLIVPFPGISGYSDPDAAGADVAAVYHGGIYGVGLEQKSSVDAAYTATVYVNSWVA